jgi:predicted ester cyclase
MSEALLTTERIAERRADLDLAQPVLDFVAAINDGDLDAAIDQLDPGALHHGRVSSYRPDGVRVLFSMLRQVFPDLRLDIREMKVDGNRVVSRIAATATHTGSFLGKPPTGKPVAWESVDIAEVESEPQPDADHTRIVSRIWNIWSDSTLWEEIGFKPALMC